MLRRTLPIRFSSGPTSHGFTTSAGGVGIPFVTSHFSANASNSLGMHSSTMQGHWATRFVYRWLPPPPVNCTTVGFISKRVWSRVPSLADRAMKSLCEYDEATPDETTAATATAAAKPSKLPHDVRAFSLRIAELAYEVSQDDTLSQPTRISLLLQKINAHRVYSENLRGLRIMSVWSDGFIAHHAECNTLVVACRGTHREEASWRRDLTDAFLLGSRSRVKELQARIAEVKEANPDLFNNNNRKKEQHCRTFLAAHSLGGGVALRYAFEVDRDAYAVVFNPGEIFLSAPGLSSLLKDPVSHSAHHPRAAIVRKPGDVITASVRAACLIVDDEDERDSHFLRSFQPQVEKAAAELHLEHLRAVQVLVLGWISVVLIAFVTWNVSKRLGQRS